MMYCGHEDCGEVKSMGDICEVGEGRWERVEVMVDSGAIYNVGPQSVGQGLDVKPNQASTIGACYHAASGHPIVNQ